MTDTARDLITNSLLDLGVLADGETPTASQAVGALRKLNNMIDAWNIQTWAVYGAQSYVFPLTPGVGTYTLGSGGTFNVPRPTNIQSAYIRNITLPAATAQDIPLYILSPSEFQDSPFKAQTIQQTYSVYFDYTYPLTTVTLYPIPSVSDFSLVLWFSGLISDLTLDTQLILPPGYLRALESNLCIELAPSYAVQVPDGIAAVARDSLSDLKVTNFTIKELRGLETGLYDIITNHYLA